MEIDCIRMDILPASEGKRHVKFTVYFSSGIITEVEREFSSNTVSLRFVDDLPEPHRKQEDWI